MALTRQRPVQSQGQDVFCVVSVHTMKGLIMVEWPSVDEIASDLELIKEQIPEKKPDDEETPSIEVRLQVMEDSQWCLHTGSAQFDDDHNGFWGYHQLEKNSDCAEIAESLLEDAQDDHFIHGEED